MDFLNINEYIPLSEDEIMYKNIFLENPQHSFDKPQKIHEISPILDKIFNSNLNAYKNRSSKPPSELMNEAIFPAFNDVIVKKHMRYSACFIHSHSFFEIIYVLSGSCTNKIGTQDILMKKGDVCIVAPGMYHAISCFSDDCIIINILIRSTTFERTFFGVLKSNDVLSSFFSRALYSPSSESYLLFTNQDDIHTVSTILEMYEEYNSKLKYSERMLNILATSLFIKLLRADEKNVIVPNPSGNSIEKNIILILNHISANYQSITLKELSSSFNYSERQMSRILKDYTGKTFVNIIQDIKVEKACELLKNPNISIQKIIDIVGYSNSSHFYRVFKSYYNITPMLYRSEYLKTINGPEVL